MPAAGSQPAPGLDAPAIRKAEPNPLPTLFGEGYGLYQTQPLTFVCSFLGHVLLVSLLVASGHFVISHRQQIRQQVVNVITDVSPYILPSSKTQAGGGGGGGYRDKL